MPTEKPTTEGPVLELVCPPQAEMLGLIRRVVAAVACDVGFLPEEIYLIEMSVDEACANIIHHAYEQFESGGGPEATIRIQLRPAADHMAIRVIDQGRGLSLQGARGVSSVEEYAASLEPHGLGTFIIEEFMDEVAYDCPSESGTVLSMVKYRRPPRDYPDPRT